MKIAIVGHKIQKKLTHQVTYNEDFELLKFLTVKGLNVTATVWNDKNVNWAMYDAIVIKSPWDYHNHITEFLSWLNKLELLNVRVLNPIETIKWNYHKKYLSDIAKSGLAVIPAEHLSQGSSFDDNLFDILDTNKLVVKPCISAGAQDTFVLDKNNYLLIKEINTSLKNNDFIVQPFVTEIKDGEWSFVFFNGKYSHCALKKPKQGDFRVQHNHGGSVSYPLVDQFHIDQANLFLTCIPHPFLYARVDGVITNNSLMLMELELIEPYLFFNGNNHLMENYYQALVELLA